MFLRRASEEKDVDKDRSQSKVFVEKKSKQIQSQHGNRNGHKRNWIHTVIRGPIIDDFSNISDTIA